MANNVLNNVSCFIGYLRYHGIFNYSDIKETEYNFIATIDTPYIDAFKDIFSSVERVKKSKKIGYDKVTTSYKVYLSKVNLVQPVNVIKFRKNGKPDMRLKTNIQAAHQTKLNAFFSTTVEQFREMKLTVYKRIVFASKQ